MTIQDVAAYLRMSSQTIYRMAQRGQIPALKIQNRWRFRRSDIESWLSLDDGSSPGCVLVVDGNLQEAGFVARTLQADGYHVSLAPTAQMAIQQVGQRPFDLIYLELALPDMSGAQVLRVIRQIDAAAGVVVITGNDERHLLHEILEPGTFTALVRPFGADEIIETARMYSWAGTKKGEAAS
ncbi:MAG: helix-turn-helix domain-containing protein [Chloroflexota bacterium]